MVVVAAFSTFAGCTPKGDSADVLTINIFEGGYGTDFIDALADIFEDENPGITVKKNVIYNASDAITEFLSGVAKTDIYFTRGEIFRYVSQPMVLNGTSYTYAIEDLTDLFFNEDIPGEEVTIAEKMSEEFLDFSSYTYKDDTTKYFTVPWAPGQMGIIINKKVWKSSWVIPNTTDELIDLCKQIKNEGVYPFVYCLDDPYWNLFSPVWAAQYDGLEAMENFWNGYDADGNRYVPEIFLYQGFLESLKVMEELLKESNGFMHPYSKTLDFTSTQNYFIDPQYNIAMTVNGDWLNRELLKNYTADEIDIELIKAPVVSALADKLGIGNEVMSAVIDAIDDGTTVPDVDSTKGYSDDEVIAAIREARGINISASGAHQAWIPAYSNSKENAKKFLQLMASDRGIEAYVKATNGHILPYDYDYFGNSELKEIMSPFLKSVNQLIIDSTDPENTEETFYFLNYPKDPLFSMSGLKQFMNGMDNYEVYFSASIAQDFKSAEDIYRENYQYVRDRWSTYKLNAGIV